MKVLMVNNQLYVLGGSETYMFSVGEELINQGHRVEYFGREDPEHKHGNRYGIYAVNSKNPLNMIINRENVKRFAKLLDLYKPDIIHFNLIYFALTPAIIYEAKKRGIPTIQTVHDPKIVCPCHRFYIEHTGKSCLKCVASNSFIPCIKNKCIKGSFFKSVLAEIESSYYKSKKTYKLIDKFIFVSNFMMKQHVGHGVKRKQSIVLHNFSRIERRTSIQKPKQKYILYFGRLGKEKGIETLAKVCKRTPSIRYKLVGIGDLEYLFKDLKNCELLGFKSGVELENIIAGAVCSVLPSIWYENCPMTVLESIALGTPVIGANVGGIPELISEGKTGMIFQINNDKQLEKHIRLLYENTNISNRMAENCIRNSELMNVHQYVEKLIFMYKLARNES